MNKRTNLLIIGAGPFGMALAVYVKHLGVEHLIVGKPAEFSKTNKPVDMLSLSAADWPLDPTDHATLDKYLKSMGKTPAAVEPLSQDFYLAYCKWFQEQSGVQYLPFHVTKLEQVDGQFEAHLENSAVIEAKQVVIAVGMEDFKHVPPEIIDLLPKGRFKHIADAGQHRDLKEKRVLILGGRQSAFEWAALLKNEGAAEVHLAHRRESPRLTKPNRKWPRPWVDQMAVRPHGFDTLPQASSDVNRNHSWSAVPSKVTPWFEKRVTTNDTPIRIHAMTKLISCTERADGAMDICLENGKSFIVDEVIVATSYKVDLGNIPFLREGNLLEKIWATDRFPLLDEQYQTTVKGLYIAGLPSIQGFDPSFRSTASVRTAAKLIGFAIANQPDHPESLIYRYR